MPHAGTLAALLLLLALPPPAGAEVGLRPFGGYLVHGGLTDKLRSRDVLEGGAPVLGRAFGQAETLLDIADDAAALRPAEPEGEPAAQGAVAVVTAGATEGATERGRREGDDADGADDAGDGDDGKKDKNDGDGDGDGDGGDGDGDGDGDEDGYEPYEEPYQLMTRKDKVWLQCGWIFIFIGIMLGLVLYSFTDDILLYKPSGDPAPQQGGALAGIHQVLYGNSTLAQALNVAIVLLAILNFYTYAEITEIKLELWCMEGGEAKYFGPDEGMDGANKDFKGGCYGDVKETVDERKGDDTGDAWMAEAYGAKLWLNFFVELGSTLFFTAITVLRISVIHVDPEWQHYGWSASLRRIATNPNLIVEIIAVSVSICNIGEWWVPGHHQHMNLLWVFFFRALDMMERAGAGLGFSKLRHMLVDDGKLLVTAFMFGLVIWTIMSCLYYLSNRTSTNEMAVWEVARYEDRTQCTKDGSPCDKDDGDEECECPILGWKKFESIPSTMWYVLINLCKEHPLADAHIDFFQRLWCIIVCIFAMPLFALPTSVLQYALLKQRSTDDDPSRFNSAVDDTVSFFGLQPLYGGLVAGSLSFFSIVSWFFYTARDTGHDSFFLIPIHIEPMPLLCVDGVVAFIFMVEWADHLRRHGKPYLSSLHGVVDLLSWLSAVPHICLFAQGSNPVSDWVLALCLIRVFKTERYLHSFRDLRGVAYESRGLLVAALFFSAFVWMTYSHGLYVTERYQYDTEMVEIYGSLMRSPWAEVINLHGEWPWADYSIPGKGIATGACLFSIMLFCIPISIIGQGMLRKMTGGDGSDESTDFDRRCWQAHWQPQTPGLQRQLYDLFFEAVHLPEGSSPSPQFRLVRAVSFLAVAASTFIVCMNTVDEKEFGDHFSAMFWGCYAVDWFLVIFFIADMAARTVALGWRHPVSIFGALQMLSLFAEFWTLKPSLRKEAFHPEYGNGAITEDIIVPMRLLRLFTLEQYIFSFHILKNVVYLNRKMLARSGSVLVSTWFCHATILYLFEHDFTGEKMKDFRNEIDECLEEAKLPCRWNTLDKCRDDEGELSEAAAGCNEDLPMFMRYDSALRALQYSIVHLFGDYPEVDYTLPAKVIHFVGIMVGIAIIASFIGTFTGGVTSYIKEERHDAMVELKQKQVMASIKVAKALQRNYRAKKQAGTLGAGPREPLPGIVITCRDIVRCSSSFGWHVRTFFGAILIIDLLNAAVRTLPEWDLARFSYIEDRMRVAECVFTMVFVVEYLIFFMAAPPPRSTSMLRPWRLFDLICLFPGLIEIFYQVGKTTDIRGTQAEAVLESLVMIRVVRILEFPIFAREVTMISRSLADAAHMLVVPAYLSLSVWIFTSSLFMWLENYWGHWLKGTPVEDGEVSTGDDAMTSVPASMYWCSIFLTGEWANVDFTFAASRLCILYVIFGISMFSIPVGIIVEAVQSTMELMAQEEADVQTWEAPEGDKAKARKSLQARKTLAMLQQRGSNAEMEMTTVSRG